MAHRGWWFGLVLASSIGCGKKAPPPTATTAPPPATTVAPAADLTSAPKEDAATADAAATPATPDAASPVTPDAASPATPDAASPATTDAATPATPDAAAAPADAAPAVADAAADAATAPMPTATAGKPVFTVDAGPEAGTPLDLLKAPPAMIDKAAAAELCKAVRDATYMSCDDDEKNGCECPIAALGAAGTSTLALMEVRANSIPGPVGYLAVIARDDKDATKWTPIAVLGKSDSGMRGESGNDVRVYHTGSGDFGAAGKWVWIDTMDTAFAMDSGTTWTRTLWVCGGSGVPTCHQAPLKSWWSAKIKGMEDFQKDVGMPAEHGVPMFAMELAIDDQGNLSGVGKTKDIPVFARAFTGTHPLASLPPAPKPEAPEGEH